MKNYESARTPSLTWITFNFSSMTITCDQVTYSPTDFVIRYAVFQKKTNIVVIVISIDELSVTEQINTYIYLFCY